LVVPALVAAQHDVARQVAALRRGMRAPVSALRFGLAALWALILAWGAVTIGWAAWFGVLHPVIAKGVPMVQNMSPMSAGFLLFVAGAGAVALIGYLVAGIAFVARRKPTAG
ncbi:MAG: hypothetical protein ACSHW6_13815, partial [Sulfitobacter geojensis]